MLATLFHPTSYLGIFVFLVLTGCGMPLPEEIAIVIAGVLSAEGHLVTHFALAACLGGAIVGDCILYAVGYRWGHSLLGVHPRLAKLLHAERERRFEQAIQQHGLKAMLLARFLVGIRGPVYLAAGAIHMPFRRFLAIDALAASIVVLTSFWLAYWVGEEVIDWIQRAERTATLLVLLVVAIVVAYVYWQGRQRITKVLLGNEAEEQATDAGEQR